MAEPTKIRRIDQRPIKEAITTRGKSIIPGLNKDELIKYFFGGNAWMSIIVLGLIMLSLFEESIGFNPAQGFFGQSYRNRLVYRQAGLEFVDIIKKETGAIDGLSRELAAARVQEFKRLLAQGSSKGKSEDQNLADANAALAPFDAYAGRLDSVGDDLGSIVSTLGETATSTKSAIKIAEDKKAEKQLYLDKGKKDLADKVVYQEVDLAAAVQPLRDAIPPIQAANTKLVQNLNDFLAVPPPSMSDALKSQLSGFSGQVKEVITSIPTREKELEAWDPKQPLGWYVGITEFFFNPDWLTASSWQDYYGILPLLVGSVLISFVALVIAVPLGVGAGVYINQIASPWEQHLIKPAIEFISAIPSVVLGFFGVAILGQSIRWASDPTPITDQGALNGFWNLIGSIIAPFSHFIASTTGIFPISERLNVVTAGILLAFMAVPTIFTLTEDAINNVPRAFKEASYALGANRLQTIWRIILPASLSGVISAVLLGFGRVIGETMVVLLCAGNRIAIPPLSDGLKVFFEPVHTMTGIIAQELGEAENGSIEWHALFMVGLLLFAISLVINFLAQRVVQRFKISIG